MGYLVGPLPQEIEARFGDRLPSLPSDQLCAAAKIYRDWIETRRASLTPKDQREAFNRIYDSLSAMARQLENLPSEAEDLIAIANAMVGKGNSTRELIAALDEYRNHVVRAERMVPEPKGGRPGTPREWLIIRLAEIVESAGQVADKRPTGPLCVATGIILSGLGEQVSRVPIIVGNALKKRL